MKTIVFKSALVTIFFLFSLKGSDYNHQKLALPLDNYANLPHFVRKHILGNPLNLSAQKHAFLKGAVFGVLYGILDSPIVNSPSDLPVYKFVWNLFSSLVATTHTGSIAFDVFTTDSACLFAHIFGHKIITNIISWATSTKQPVRTGKGKN